MLKNCRFGFDPAGLILFLAVMLPNFVWFAVPAPDDVLRGASVTGTPDAIGSVCQVLMTASLCFIVRRDRTDLRASGAVVSAAACVLFYYLCWGLYYAGRVSPAVLLGLTLFPCAAFLFYSFDRRNWIAAIFALAFSVCHLTHTVVNYLL